ncbi:glycerophosphodiester phosphodiesterase family protein [Rhodococcus daqingensis]|uniref:Glycerophosphodiester phosphodiesterase family protein n=1 Tax=Rhodococcus daqingensis TaxID=2479363 RepID=A0ABW2S1E9_9NOCA
MKAALLTLALATSAAAVLGTPGAAAAPPSAFDLQAHRGGRGLVVENTLPAFANALDLGVSTLELDLAITRDGRDVITHDAAIDSGKCADTQPATPGDPQFPYVGKFIKDLTFDQVRTVDCGSRAQSDYPGQRTAPGAKMPTLDEVFALARTHSADDVRFSIELKTDANGRETASREAFVQRAVQEIARAGMRERAAIQSFDWGTLILMHQTDPGLRLYALTDPTKVYPFSPWLGGLHPIQFGGSLVRTAKSFGATALSPMYALPPDGSVSLPLVTRAMVDEAHDNGMLIVPWTANDTAAMRSLLDQGVDGIITDYPDHLREVMRERGLPLPPRYPVG